jgi:hypothetical protein
MHRITPSLSVTATADEYRQSSLSAVYFGKYFTMYSDRSSAMSLSAGLKTM